MSWFRQKSRRRESELDSELGFHLQELIDGKIAEGLPPRRSPPASPARIWRKRTGQGGMPRRAPYCHYRKHHREFEIRASLHQKIARLFQRQLILTLALGIGANSAVFSAIDAVLLRSLPFPESQQLVVLHQLNPKQKSPENFVAPVRLEDWYLDVHTATAIAVDELPKLRETIRPSTPIFSSALFP